MIAKDTSQRITSLRFLLIILVVFVHNNITKEYVDILISNGQTFIFSESKVGQFIQYLISFGIAEAAVPVFFLFSAYLQSIKSDKYSVLIQKKTKSLVIPYFLWILFYCIINRFIPSSFSEFIHYTIGFSTLSGGTPLIASQFWFIRDLIILSFLSPILKYSIKKVPLIPLIISFFVYCTITIKYDAEFHSALFYYLLGFYWGTYEIDLFKYVDKIKWKEVFFIFSLILLCRLIKKDNQFVKSIQILSAVLVLLKTSQLLVSSKNIFAITEKLSAYSFFLYAVHMPILLHTIQKLFFKFFTMKNTFFCLLEYFGVSFVTILAGTLIGVILKRFIPPVFLLLVGGRKA